MLLSAGSWWLCTAIIVLAWTWRYIIYPGFISPLSKIPNAHWSVPFSRIWALSIRFRHTENRSLRAAHLRLGAVIRVAPNELSIDDISCVRTVYQGGFDKGDWYAVFDNFGVPCMFSTGPSQEHSLRKRMISNVYSKSYLHASAAGAAQAHVILFGRMLPILLESVADRQKPHGIDVHSLFLATTMDFISAYVFGIAGGPDFLGRKAYREHWLELYKSRVDYGMFDQELPRLTDACRRVGIPFCPKWVDAANEELREWCRRLCEAALRRLPSAELNLAAENPADEAVVFNAIVAGLDKEAATNGKGSPLYPTALTHRDLTISSEILDHVLAGQETAGVTLTYLTWRLSQSPDLQRDLQAELRGLEPNMRVANSEHDDHGSMAGSIPNPRQLDSLPLLHAIVMETLRLHAPIPGPQPRQSPFPSSQIGGYNVPGGVRVAAMAYGLHRNESVFPDPERWDPNRWLPVGASEEERKQQNRIFWAFGSGGRMCVGSNFAMHEMKLIVAAIYSNFTSYIVNDDGVAEQGDGYTSRPSKEQLYLRFEKLK